MKRILMLIDYSSEFSRRILQGLIRYSNESGPWIFYRLPSYYKTLYGNEGIIRCAKEWKADAIVARWDHEDTLILENLHIPVILQNYRERSPGFSNLTGDYFATGVMAAQFFLKRRYRNFAFYGNKGVIWSRERAEGFRKEVENYGGDFYYFEGENLGDDEWSSSYIQMEEWLRSLPKPVGLFACDDKFALQVSTMCKINNIRIPEEISLMGVDNDELICNLSDPPISSIVLDVEKGGYEAGQLINELISKERCEPFDIKVRPVRFKLRQSTEHYNISNEYISKIVGYIEENFTRDLTIGALTRLVPLSRRSLEIKFKEEMDVSIYQYILHRRIEHLADLLLTTDHPLFDLAVQSGINDYKNISRIFKKFKIFSPHEFRLKFRSVIPERPILNVT